MSALLEIENVTKRFGGLCAISKCGLAVEAGRTHGIIGPNGAGKTTLFNLITGIYKPTEGAIRFRGKSIAGQRPGRIALGGIARTFQNIRLCRNLTALDNVRIAFDSQLHHSSLSALFRLPWQDATSRNPSTKACVCSSRSASRNTRTSSPASCPTDCSASSRSPARSP